MKWTYRCSHCGVNCIVDWENREKRFICHKCKKTHSPPSPAQQPSAFVDTHNWPQEMEDAVINAKGHNCTVPGCKKKNETLDHRLAWSKGGKTSVENLWPMCIEHNQSKGDEDYQTWLNSLTK